MTIWTRVDSPLGALLLIAEDGALTGLYYTNHRRGPQVGTAWTRDDGPFAAVRAQLDEYFAGRRQTFDLEVRPDGTAFQRDVWTAMAHIGYGRTATYADLAAQVGRPGAARAVGAAVARNPVSIVLPCHRVVGASGSLTGYAGGTDRKRTLLDLEAAAHGSLTMPAPAG